MSFINVDWSAIREAITVNGDRFGTVRVVPAEHFNMMRSVFLDRFRVKTAGKAGYVMLSKRSADTDISGLDLPEQEDSNFLFIGKNRGIYLRLPRAISPVKPDAFTEPVEYTLGARS